MILIIRLLKTLNEQIFNFINCSSYFHLKNLLITLIMKEAKEFPTMESEINHGATNFVTVLRWIIVILFAFLSIIWIEQLIRTDFLEYYITKKLDLLASILIIILSSSVSFFLGYYLLTKKYDKYTVSVNYLGAFILDRYGKISEQILYTDLHAATEKYKSDIILEFNGKFNKQRLVLYIKINSNEVTNYNLSFQKDFYKLQNNFELYQHF